MTERYIPGYDPSLDDWRGLVALAPEHGRGFEAQDEQRLALALRAAGDCLRASGVESPADSDVLLVTFYVPYAPRLSAVHDSLATICLATRQAKLQVGLAGMQLASQFDIQLYGSGEAEAYLASEDCAVPEAFQLYHDFDRSYSHLRDD
jgi:hypothetical protein